MGDEITFKNKMPWISGKLSQLHGDIDISYRVKGTKGEGLMRFKSIRRSRMGLVCVSLSELILLVLHLLTREAFIAV